MRAHASVLRGSRRPRRQHRELVRLLRCDDYLFSPKRAVKYADLTHEFQPQLRALLEALRERRERLAAFDAQWEITVVE